MSERIRLLKFLNVFAIGGTERQFVNVVQRLDRGRFDLHLACLHKGGAFLKDVEACGDPLTAYEIHSFHNLHTVQAQLRFARDLQQERIQVLHTYGFYTNLFGIPAARLAGVPVIVASIRDTGAHLTPLRRRVQRAVCTMADCILANADAVRDWLLAEGYPDKKIRVVQNGIVMNENNASEHKTLREQYEFAPNAPLIGTACRLNSVKAVNIFLDAAALVLTRHPEARFVVIGDGPDRAALEAQSARLGLQHRLVFTGFRTDTQQILGELTISVLSSLTEGLSNTLLESMAAGVPVVATRVGGTPEFVSDGVHGFLVPPSDAESLSASICRLLDDSAMARKMGESGKQRIERDYSMERAVRRTEHLYTELLESYGR